MRLMPVYLCVLHLLLAPPITDAQAPAPAPAPGGSSLEKTNRQPSERAWSASVVMGTTSSGPARDLERAMRDGQFDESRGGCILGLCLPGTEHPFSRTGWSTIAFPWHVGVQRRLSSWYGVGLSAGRAGIGLTLGQKRDRLEYLEVSYSVATVAPTFVVGPGHWLRAAAGPAFYASTFEAGATDTYRGLGVVGELAVALPRRSRVFGELLAQYRRVGSVEAGPFSTSANPVSTLPATEVDMNHWFVGLGVGVRF